MYLQFLIFYLISIELGMTGRIGDCSNGRYFLRTFGINNVPKSPIQGEKLQICSGDLTCCTEEMEQKLWATSRKQYNKAMSDAVGEIKSLFANRAYKFDDFFIDLLANSKIQFHKLFQKLYGIVYERNSDVFIDFFKDLQTYYDTGEVDLEDALQRFFEQLYLRMFEVYNSHHDFDKNYLNCVSATMKKLQPFGNVPKKLTEQLRRSFVATRTFSQGLLEGKKIANKIIKLAPKDQCLAAWTKMLNCPACQGHQDVRPCQNYCLNVMRGCLAYYSSVDELWDNFVVSLQNVTDRLVGLFDIEGVVEPIGLKISDAIMHFHNNGFDLSLKVFDECGTPKIQKRSAEESSNVWPRRRRHYVDKDEDILDSLSFYGKKDSKLKRLIREIKVSIGKTLGFWGRLPGDICSEVKDSAKNKNKCWNGVDIASYEKDLVEPGLTFQDKNPEVVVDVTKPDIRVNEQILVLKLITRKLENATNGDHVSWEITPYTLDQETALSGDCENSDDEDCYSSADYDYYGYSGSGSGDDEDREYTSNVHKNSQTYEEYDSISEDEEEDNWPPWVTPKSSSETHGEKTTTTQNISKTSNPKTSNTSASGRLSSAWRGLLYYLVPLFTCLLGNAVSTSW